MAKQALNLNTSLKEKMTQFEQKRYETQLTTMQTGKQDENKMKEMQDMYAELIEIDEAKKFLLQRARAKMKRHRNTSESSQLESLITAMVNTEQFPYNYEDVGQLSIYQFNESLQQVIKKIDFDNKMHGIYAGTLSAKDLSQDELNWLTHK